MTITFFSTQPYDKAFFTAANKQFGYQLVFHTHALSEATAATVNGGVVCIFVNDACNAAVVSILAQQGVKLVALRCAGYNNIDAVALASHNIPVVRVPAYSPHAVAEHAVALLMTLNRKTHKAYNRVREQNFSLNGLIGFDVYGKTVGVIGTGNIGQALCRIMLGFGCRVLAFDVVASKPMEDIGVQYTDLGTLFAQSDILSLHCPLNEQTHHMINAESLATMKQGVVLINTSRGGLVDTHAAIRALKSGKLGGLGIDVYEQEEKLFFRDLSGDIIQDDTIQRLMSFPNVLVTAHQAFFTHEALTQIASITLGNVKAFQAGESKNRVQ